MTPNAQRNAEIIRRRESGELPAQIASEMGLSRNTVIGVLNRAGKCTPGRSILSEAEVRAIRETYQFGVAGSGYGALAKSFGVCGETVKAVVTGKTWKHIA